MGNLKQKYTPEEWDELVNSTKPEFVEKRIKLAIHEAAERHWDLQYTMAKSEEIKPYVINDFVSGAEWMLNQIKSIR